MPSDKIKDFFFSMFDKNNWKLTVILLYAAIMLTLWKYLPGSERFADDTGRVLIQPEKVTIPLFCFGMKKMIAAFMIMGVIPALIVKFIFREKLSDYGLSLGIKLRTFRTMLIIVPIMAFSGWLSGMGKFMYSAYPMNPYAATGSLAFAIHSIVYLFLFYLAWEFMFRGFMQYGLMKNFGLPAAVLVQTMASVMLHYGNPPVEVFMSVPAGLFWGFFSWRTRSVISGACQHAALGIMMDAALIHYAIY